MASEVEGLKGDGGNTIEMDQILMVSPEVSEDEQPRKSRRKSVQSMPNPVQMDVAGFKTGKTPTVERDNEGDAAFKLTVISASAFTTAR